VRDAENRLRHAGSEDQQHDQPGLKSAPRTHLRGPRTKTVTDRAQQGSAATNPGHHPHGEVGRRHLGQGQHHCEQGCGIDDDDPCSSHEVGPEVEPGPAQPAVDRSIGSRGKEGSPQNDLQGNRHEPEGQNRFPRKLDRLISHALGWGRYRDPPSKPSMSTACGASGTTPRRPGSRYQGSPRSNCADRRRSLGPVAQHPCLVAMGGRSMFRPGRR